MSLGLATVLAGLASLGHLYWKKVAAAHLFEASTRNTSEFSRHSGEEEVAILRKFHPNLVSYEVQEYLHMRVYLVESGNSRQAVYEVFSDIDCPVCRDVRFFAAIDSDGLIEGLELIHPWDLFGEPIGQERVDRILDQLLGRDLEESRGLEIDGIAGATKTIGHFREGLERIRDFRRSK